MLDPSQIYRFEVVLLRPEEFDLLDNRIKKLESELKKVKAERDRYYLAMSEYPSLKARISLARKIIKRLGGDPDKYNL